MVVTTSSQLFQHPLQYIEETTLGEGVTPTSGSTTATPPVQTLSLNIDGQFIDISQVGNEDMASIIQGLQK